MHDPLPASRASIQGTSHVKSRLRVLMIIQTFRPIIGGAEMQLERLAPFLAEQGIEVTILTRSRPGAPKYEQIPGAEVHRLWSPPPAPLASALFTLLSILYAWRHRGQIDVIHAHGLLSPTTAALAAQFLARKPTVVKLMRTDELERLLVKPFGRLRFALARSRIDLFISISTAIRDVLVQSGIPPHRIVDIPSGVDTRTFQSCSSAERQKLRSRLGLPYDQLLGLYVGRLDPVKNVDLLLQAWKCTGQGCLIIVGDGPSRDMLQNVAHELGITSSVRFAGWSTEAFKYMQASDWFVQPSSKEGLSSTMLEAMACGLPGVITRVSGAEDVVIDGVDGLLVAPNDVAALAEAIERLVASPSLRAELGVAARQTIVTRYSVSRAARLLAALYSRLTGRIMV